MTEVSGGQEAHIGQEREAHGAGALEVEQLHDGSGQQDQQREAGARPTAMATAAAVRSRTKRKIG
ncbi:hypothetical protein [Streptomyces ipomoeae]|nr:hypothetical protein [Streptomyces ipomoeae]MDX2693850.1 hypothetical protein [Streptomyces ipomoeae]MDX2837687.1 hypothetical protein [Streptomyces ipomoeae]